MSVQNSAVDAKLYVTGSLKKEVKILILRENGPFSHKGKHPTRWRKDCQSVMIEDGGGVIYGLWDGGI